MKIGIYGGTFDPPHLGHMEAARAAMEQLGLDRLLIVPDREPPHDLTRYRVLVRGEQHAPVLATVKVGRPSGAPP